MENLLTATENERDFEKRFEENFQIEFPVMLGLATREEIDRMTVDELNYLNYRAKKIYKMQHPELVEED